MVALKLRKTCKNLQKDIENLAFFNPDKAGFRKLKQLFYPFRRFKQAAASKFFWRTGLKEIKRIRQKPLFPF
jgi:hypothetical protein